MTTHYTSTRTRETDKYFEEECPKSWMTGSARRDILLRGHDRSLTHDPVEEWPSNPCWKRIN